MKIVVAEDEILNQRLAMMLLLRLGHHVHCVSNGRELVDYLGHEQADLAFVDIHMPELDGLNAAREIVRRWKPTVRPVLIGLSASVDPQEVHDCLLAGMDGFLRKPAGAHELQEVIDTWMWRRRNMATTQWHRLPGPVSPFPLPSIASR